MKKRKYLFVGATVLILLLSTTGSLALVKSNEKEPLSRGPELEVTTDKTVYEIGEMVTIFFTNIGDEILSGGGPIVTIYNNQDEIVYQEACYCYWEIEPGEYEEWPPWDQTNKHGNQVPVGKYTVEGFLTGNEQNYVDTATFYILDYSPYGPTLGVVNISYTFCIDLPDDGECEPYLILWDFGDGTGTVWMGPYPAGETVCIEHSWIEPGDYDIRVKIRDACDNEYWTDPLVIHIGDNSPPSTPIITGPCIGIPGRVHGFTVTSEDPDVDDISYTIDWGDDNSDTTGYNPSGTGVKVRHTWSSMGDFTIRAKAKDIWGAESDWGTKPITVIRTRAINTPFLSFLKQHPNIFPLLKLLIKTFGL